jgi:hypothetical protein
LVKILQESVAPFLRLWGEGPAPPLTWPTASILNIGTQLRARHFDMFLKEINKMVAGVT